MAEMYRSFVVAVSKDYVTFIEDFETVAEDLVCVLRYEVFMWTPSKSMQFLYLNLCK